jgi:HK97 family phage major capsid protein
MSKELRELLNRLNNLQDQASELMNKEGVTSSEIKAKTEEIKSVKAMVEAQKIIDEGREFDPNGIELSGTAAKEQKKEKEDTKNKYQTAFLNSFRGKPTNEDIKIINALAPGAPADGGLLLPSDIQTSINQYKRSLPQLESLINIIPVNRASGSRVFEKLATMVPLQNITDLNADLPDMGNPQFENVTYAIKDYAGYMPVPNDLLDDTDQNLIDYLTAWIGRKSVVTRNSLILTLISTLAKVTFADWKAIKKAINITLDPMLATGASVVTNQDGYQYLDTLVDSQGKPLLQPDLANPGGVRFSGKPIVTVPNTVLATTGTTTKMAPMIVGNLPELVTMFERKGHQVASTNVGGTAFQKNRTEIRVIEREDTKLIDSSAAVYGEIDVTAVI